MPPNARPPISLIEESVDDVDQSEDNSLTEMLDQQADTKGFTSVSGAEDWTDVKHSERKKRDRILDDGVLIKLMKKSDREGFKRLAINLSVLALTIICIHCLFHSSNGLRDWKAMAAFVPLYFFYGFQFQCFAFAGQHEFLHRNAFKTKWINDVCLFVVSVVCFEMGAHEQVMHKQHHTFTNHIDRDPELTSYYSREQLENPGFRNVPFSKWDFIKGFVDVFSTFKQRAGRIFFSALAIPVDYSGTSWSLAQWNFEEETMRRLQRWAIGQITWYLLILMTFGRTQQGRQALLFWWIVPVLIGYPAVNYFRNLEHADCEVSKISNCLRNTRSVRSNLIIRTLLWDTNFHAEHHCYPMVPFYNLHKINELLYDHVVHNERDHFSTQNWAAIMPGGWIDQQADRVRCSRPNKPLKARHPSDCICNENSQHRTTSI